MRRTSCSRTFASLAVALLLLISAAVRVHATTLVRLSLEQLSQASSDIVGGHVLGQESGWNASHTQIMTVTRMAVEQRMKGQAPEVIEIEQPGGKVGNIRVYVPGSVHFLPEGKYLLFLEPSRGTPSRYLVVGMAQGAYRVYKDGSSGEEQVIRPLGSRFYRPGASASPTTSLKQFRQELTNAMQSPLSIPAGTLLAVTVEATETSGAGRFQVEGRTARDVFPGRTMVLPAGSLVEGAALKEHGVWTVHWSDIIVRGVRVPISAISVTPPGTSLRGNTVLARVQ